MGEGNVIGTLCVYGTEPRVWTWDDVELLVSIAGGVMDELDGRRAKRAGEE
ncbi:MAG: GAF domain-containing protein [Gemmatimonadaceae bacterium]